MKSFVLEAGVIGLTLLSACSGGSTGPTAGTLEIRFSSSATDDGAVLFTITGGPIGSVDAVGYTVYSARPAPNTLRVIVAGNLSSGTIAQLHVPDRDQVSRYSISLDQVASSGTHVERDPKAYGISLVE
jgi:hypothetical protein